MEFEETLRYVVMYESALRNNIFSGRCESGRRCSSRRAHRPNSHEVRQTAACDNASLRVPTLQIDDPALQIATQIKHSREQYRWNCITQATRKI
jgi:hypothetical protein